MKKKVTISILSLLSIILLGGCQLVKENEQKNISYKDIVNDGKIDVEMAKKAGYVSLEEKEKLGYYDIESSSNKKVQKQALEQKDSILEKIEPIIKENIQREVKLLGIQSPFPYPTVSIDYITIDEPVVSSRVAVGLEDSSYFTKDGVKDISGGEELGSKWQRNTIGSLYGYVYEHQLKEFKKEFIKKYPQYQENPSKISEIYALRLGLYTIYPSSVYGEENTTKQKEEINRLFQIYKENPKQSNEEWQKIFSNSPLKFTLSFNFIVIDESILPTKKMAEDVFNDLQNSTYTSNFSSFRVVAESNMQATDKNASLHSETKFIDNHLEENKQ